MSSKPSSLLRVPVEMPNRSGHNLSHSNAFTGKTGTLYPVLCEELLPNDTVSLGANLQVQFPPMVTDFYGRVDYVLEAFFVPNRLCWGGWEDFITHPTANPQYPVGTPVEAKPDMVPFLLPEGESLFSPITTTSLLHYLDYGNAVWGIDEDTGLPPAPASVLKAVAYHRIWDDWYRDSRVQSPLFYKSSYLAPGLNPQNGMYDNILSTLPYRSISTTVESQPIPFYLPISASFTDGVRVDSLRQRNWVKDYFTTCSPLPQAGGGSEVKFDVSTATESGAFSIATLRAANSLNLWRLS